MTKQKYIRRIRFGLAMVWCALAFCSMVYVAQWQSGMEDYCVIGQQLRQEGAGHWLKPLLEEMQCFPVRTDVTGRETWSYENGYGEGRSYGGARKHEGIDIMSSTSRRGYFAIQSVSDGTVEQIGWLELGGYRIGIRSTSGLYYYYAHMDSYAAGLKKGDRVKAGQLLGYMGDSGYGEEGTKGKFAVHLHFGIYYREGDIEKSLNPFYLLQYQEYGIIRE